jgi:hypothetical protein
VNNSCTGFSRVDNRIMEQQEKSIPVMIRQEKRQEEEEPSRTSPEPSRTVGEASITPPLTVPQSRETRSTSNLGQQGDQEVSSAAMSSPTASRDPAPITSNHSNNPTFLLTQAAHISTFKASGDSSTSSSKLASPKVTPPTIALESPGSPQSQSVDDSTRSPTSANTPSSASKANRKRGVPHIYRDYFSVPDTIGYVRKKTGGVTQPFPEKLHELLDHEPEPTIVSWLPHGRAFLVRKPKEFTQDVMPR